MVNIFTARKRSLGQGNIFIGMCQEFCSRGGGGGSGSVHARNEAVHAGKEAPPWEGSSACWEGSTPLPCTLPPPQDHAPLPLRDQGDTVNARAVRILLECNLVNYNSDPTYAQKSALISNRTIVFFILCIRLVEVVELG